VQFTITADFRNVRLDRFLRKKYQEIPLTTIFRLIRKGHIRVNGKKKKQDYRLQEHDLVNVNISTAPSAEKPLRQLSPAEHKLAEGCIVHEDSDLVLCNKPPGLVMHRGSGHDYGLVELLQAFFRNPQFTFVNRIDRATAGLVIGAKTPAAARKLSELFRQQAIEKYYLIMVMGRIGQDNFTLTSYLKKEEERVKEHADECDGARKSISSFTVLQRFDNCTLLRAHLLTGRTHQLRVQLAGQNHPIIGDLKYGGAKAKNKKMLLFSQRVVITALGLDVSLPVPEYYFSITTETRREYRHFDRSG
jgi:23S rRNA pseudouridine955/2504/2580 synthase